MTAVPGLAAADQPAPLAIDVPLQKTNLLGLALADLEAKMVALGLPKFRARQVWRWVWRHGLGSFDEMSDLGQLMARSNGLSVLPTAMKPNVSISLIRRAAPYVFHHRWAVPSHVVFAILERKSLFVI